VLLSRMTLLESGDEMLVFDPDYAAHARLARLLGVTPFPCPADADFRVSVDEVKRRVTPGQPAGAPDGAAGHLHAGRQADDCVLGSGRAVYPASANCRRQHGHSPSCPWIRAKNAVGCGMVMIALDANKAYPTRRFGPPGFPLSS
jgi:hypothetical protein